MKKGTWRRRIAYLLLFVIVATGIQIPAAPKTSAETQASEIGRASCRERV